METPLLKHLEVREKLCPALRDNFWFLGYVMKLVLIFVPVARETTLEAQGQILVYAVYISLIS